MSKVYTYKILNEIKNSQLIKLGKNVALNRTLQWGYFNVRDPCFKQNVTNFIFDENSTHKKIILGQYDHFNSILPISYI